MLSGLGKLTVASLDFFFYSSSYPEFRLLSNAVAGQYFLYGDNSEWGDDCWWWDCYCPASNDHLRVKEISIELNLLDVDAVIRPSNVGMSDELTSMFQAKFYGLRDFYAQASKHDLAVVVYFG